MLFTLKHGKHGEKYNVQGEIELDNLEVAQFVAKELGKELKYTMHDNPTSRPGHDLRYALDGDKLRELGWKLPLTFFDSLRKTIRWMVQLWIASAVRAAAIRKGRPSQQKRCKWGGATATHVVGCVCAVNACLPLGDGPDRIGLPKKGRLRIEWRTDRISCLSSARDGGEREPSSPRGRGRKYAF